MDKDTAPHPQGSDKRSSSTRRNIQTNARLEAILTDFNRPLDDIDWSRAPSRSGNNGKSKGIFERLNRQRRHRRDLRRARRAAYQAFHIKPKLSARRRATLMLGAGALGLTAFTGPPKARKAFGIDEDMQRVVDDVAGVRKPAALMKASGTFKQALIEEEGVRYTVYRDVAGYPTVGVGHLILPEDDLQVGDRVDEAQVLQFLEHDLAKAEQGVRLLVGDLPLHQHEFDALLDLVYNVGLGNVSENESPRLNTAIESRDYEAIAAELDYTHAGGKFARGLQFRSERRAKIFMKGRYGDPRQNDDPYST
tara:strand:+ start:2235 stop:3158 length:924 start_codon:yes stop_codon:yes gene_type:complete